MPKPTKQPTSFLPDDYEVKTGENDFFKLQQGENKFRIVSQPEIGKEGWKDNKPFRRSGADAVIDEDEVDTNDQGKPKISDYMAMYVYDYATSKVAIASFTQATIKKAILEYSSDKDWGHPSKYDFTVTKTGEGLKTKYSVKPSIPKPLATSAQRVVDEAEESFDLKTALSIDAD